jgi:hypothetical protein
VKELTRLVKKIQRDNSAKRKAKSASIEYREELVSIAEANLAKALQELEFAQGKVAKTPNQRRFQKLLRKAQGRFTIEQNRLATAQWKLQFAASVPSKVCSLPSNFHEDVEHPEKEVHALGRLAKAETIKRERSIRFARKEKEDRTDPPVDFDYRMDLPFDFEDI